MLTGIGKTQVKLKAGNHVAIRFKKTAIANKPVFCQALDSADFARKV
ncbi:hypothetical protein [Spirosoma humi]